MPLILKGINPYWKSPLVRCFYFKLFVFKCNRLIFYLYMILYIDKKFFKIQNFGESIILKIFMEEL